MDNAGLHPCLYPSPQGDIKSSAADEAPGKGLVIPLTLELLNHEKIARAIVMARASRSVGRDFSVDSSHSE
jgi:hypothetical protein